MQTPLQAAIGIGSNSIRLLVTRRSANKLETVFRDEEVTRLAAYDTAPDGTQRLNSRAMDATLEATRQFALEARGMGADLRAVLATEALRAASNGGEFAERLGAELEAEVVTLDAEEEARLGWVAVARHFERPEGALGVIDIGGGSMDLSVGSAGAASPGATLSIPVGAHELSRRYGLHKPVEYSKTVGLIASLGIEMHDPVHAMSPRPERGVVIGGTGEVLAWVFAALEGGEPFANASIDRMWLGRNVVRMASLDRTKRAEMGVPEDRADIAPAAGIALLVVLDAWGLSEFHVSERGILDGYLLGALE
jgi:exopolyphosphatase / guanosine-5'-triphosphate,3'-diphosphate pyrophosphatase